MYGRYIIERESPYTANEKPDADFFAGVLFSAAAAGPETSANRAIDANSTEPFSEARLTSGSFEFSIIGFT